MSNSNQEIIEARLATYIDDELDVGERAEIEQHLQQNPQYRRLLEDLRKGKQMLRALPRESAPTEFADAFFVQLERSGLLDGDGEPSPSRLRIDSWPRWVAAAAVVFLTVGLAAIVYFVLPRHDPHTIAFVPAPIPEAIEESAESRVDKGEPNLGNAPIPKAVNATDPIAAAAAPSHPIEAAKGIGTVGGGNGTVDQGLHQFAGQGGAALDRLPTIAGSLPPTQDDLGRLASAVSRDPRVKDLLADQVAVTNTLPTASADAVVMAVRASDLAKVQKELNAYFALRNIDVQPVSQPVEMALNASLSHPAEALKDAASPNPTGADGSNAAREKQAVDKAASALSDRAPANASAAPGAGQAVGKTGALQQQVGPPSNDLARKRPAPVDAAKSPAMAPGAPAAAPAPTASHPPAAPAFGSRPPAPTPTVAVAPANGGNANAPEAHRQERQSPLKSGALVGTVTPANSFLIARRLSRLQARELTDCLSRAGEVREADVEQRDASGVSENKISEGQSNVATSLPPNGSNQGSSARATDALAISPAAGSAPASADKASLRDEVGGRGASVPAGSASRPAFASAETRIAPHPTAIPPDADAQRRALGKAPGLAPGATTQQIADADRFIDVVIVVQNPAPAEQNLSFPPAPSVSPIKAAPATRPSTQPASLPSGAAFPPAK